MKNKENLQKIALRRIIIIMFVIVLIFNIITGLNNLTSLNNNEKIYLIIIFIIGNIIKSIFYIAPLVTIIVSIINAKKTVLKENMSNIDFSKSKEYYREILKKHSPIELSYIDDFQLNNYRDIIATLLNLKLKKKINFNNKLIEIINNNTENLTISEKVILSNIINGKVKINNFQYMLKCAEEEALENKLITKGELSKKQLLIQIIKKIIPLIITTILIKIGINNSNAIFNITNKLELSPVAIIMIIICIVLCLFSFLFFYSIYGLYSIIFYAAIKSKSYKRTEYGEEINKKIEGLKKYIKDFSILSERDQEELVIWDEYLIYSVIFDMNDKIIQELSPLIEFTN